MQRLRDRYRVLTNELMEEIASGSKSDQGRWLILEESRDFHGHWRVECLDPSFFFDFEELIGPYRCISPLALQALFDLCDELDYRVAFAEPPDRILLQYDHLNDPAPFNLNSSREGTIQGFYPWQLQGFNFLKDKDGGKVIWSTGTGKTALAAALVKYYLANGTQLVFYTAKVHARINTVRKLKALGDIDAIVLDSYSIEKREELYADVFRRLNNGEQVVCVLNYEKFRDDEEAMKIIVTDRDVLVIWDEMPTKLSNRGIQLYESVLRTFWRTIKDKPGDVPNPLVSRHRCKSYKAYELTASPIEKDPEGDFNCTRLIAPKVFGSVSDWRSEYVSSYNFFDDRKPETFHQLDKMALKQAHFTHVVNKKDPDIAKFFPKVVFDTIEVDWYRPHKLIYQQIENKASELIEGLEEVNVLALMGVMQMMCDAPSMINISAKNREFYERELSEWLFSEDGREPDPRGSTVALEIVRNIGTLSDTNHGKLSALRDIIQSKHPGEHGLIYTSFGPMLLPILSAWLDKWGISHVVYRGTNAARQRALDNFCAGGYQIFLSSDAGSDSIDLELASFGIDYDLPWKYSTRYQRWSRFNRAGANHESQYAYTLVMEGSMEYRKLEVISQKQGYHEAIYEGKLNDQALTSRLTKEDLMYILTGARYAEIA